MSGTIVNTALLGCLQTAPHRRQRRQQRQQQQHGQEAAGGLDGLVLHALQGGHQLQLRLDHRGVQTEDGTVQQRTVSHLTCFQVGI